MALQNTLKPKLPRWLSFTIAFVFLAHFFILAVYHFSRYAILPQKLWYYAEAYVSPWFYQYFVAFAPEPPMESRRFLYKWKDEEGWSRWQYPAGRFLREHWAAPWGPSSEMYDMVQALAENLYKTAARNGLQATDTSVRWRGFPAMEAAERYIAIEAARESMHIDSFRVVVWIEKHTLLGNNMYVSDSLLVFPKYAWRE